MDAFVPLSFAPGEAYQFDWSHEVVLINGTTVTVKVAHIRLCHSRMPFVRAYPRETQEMVFDAHDRAFAFFKGTCTRGIYDNMKTAVETIFVGRERAYNRRFLQMCSHYLVDPVACTPASGWEKGQVENQVGQMRERLFTPRLRVKSYDELNAWLIEQCVLHARVHRHPEIREQTIWQMFEAERPSLVPYAGPFDGFHAVPASVSKTCLIRFDNNGQCPEQSPNPGSWVTQWFNGKSSFKTANPVSVPTTTTVPSINAAMVQGGSISGTVTGGGNPQQGICVAIDPGTPGGIVKVQTQTDNNGNYTLSNVAAGTYKVVFLGFPFEAYGTASDKADLMKRVRAYLS